MTAALDRTFAVEGMPAPAVSPTEDLRRARAAGVQVVDVRFSDLPGTWQHRSVPLAAVAESTVVEGRGFDGSSIREFQAIRESDMLRLPDPAMAFVDPCLQVPTLSLTCDIVEYLSLTLTPMRDA